MERSVEMIDHDRRRYLVRLAASIAGAGLGVFGVAQATDRESRDFSGLDRATEWINSPRLTAASLAGKVVLVDFWTYIEYPVAIDNEYAIWRAFRNQYWPALFFVDARGRVRDHHLGEGKYEQSERTMQKLLAEAGGSAPPRSGGGGCGWRRGASRLEQPAITGKLSRLRED